MLGGEHTTGVVLQAPLAAKNGASPAGGRRAASCSPDHKTVLCMSAVEEPWFEEARATVLFDVDDLK